MTSLRFAIVGAGRLGASLALALRAQGPSLVAYTALTPAGRSRADSWLGGTALSELRDVVRHEPDVYLITVPDSVLPEVASQLSSVMTARSGQFVAHTSGATSVEVLQPCEDAGAATLVFHPLQTFPDPVSGQKRFEGTAVAITPGDSAQDSPAQALGFALATLLRALPFVLADDKRTLYHAAATMACNYFITLEHLARGLFVQAGLPSDEALAFFLPLIRATLDNMQAQGTVGALTGPLSRGDVQTIRAHLHALAVDSPQLLTIYKALGLATLDLVRSRGEIEASTIGELVRLLSATEGNEISPTDVERIRT